jgi:hypothetical protein
LLNAVLAPLAVLMMANPGVVHADTVTTLTFNLTSDDCTGNCGPQTGGFGNIVVTDLSTNVVGVTVTLLNGNKFVDTGAGAALGFNLSGSPTITYGNVTTGFTPVANPETAGVNHMDGTGDFQYAVNCTGCGSGGSNPLAGPLSFQITGTGLSTASFDQNASLQFFSVDILSGTTGKTGDVDASNSGIPGHSQVPGPIAGAGWPGIVVASFGLVALARRRRSAAWMVGPALP